MCVQAASESFVRFATCTLPLDGGECIYLQNKINSNLGSHNRGCDKKLAMDLKSDPVHKNPENFNLVISILPSVDEKFQVGWASLGQSRMLKFTFGSKQAMFLVQSWMSKIKLTKGDTDMRITFNGCSYPKTRSSPDMTFFSKSEPICQQKPLVTIEGACTATDADAISGTNPAGKCDGVMFRHSNSPTRTNVIAGVRRGLPMSALAKRGGAPPRKVVATLDDIEWAAELAHVRRRLDSVVVLSRLR
jgi:hypothetical protein